MALSVSIITPSFNQAIFLPECLQSVANQSYPALEHFVYDPGSKDDSREIARSYSHATLIAEPDQGQSDAVSKGFLAAQGDIIGWLNSDDCYARSDVFAAVIERFQHPDAPDIVYGQGTYIDDQGQYLRDAYVNEDPESLSWRLHKEVGILQPALFLRRSVIDKIGILSSTLHFCMDYEYWIRAMKAGLKFAFLPKLLAHGRYYKDNKTLGNRGESLREVCNMVKQQFGYVHIQWIRNYAEFIAEGFDGILAHSKNSKVTNQNAINDSIAFLLKAYNTDYYTLDLLKENRNSSPYDLTVKAMAQSKVNLDFFCHPIPLEQKTQPNCYCYTVGDKRWAFNRQWKDRQIEKTQQAFENFRSERLNDTCVIVGNGPSLNKTDLSLLENQDVFITNYAFLNPQLLSSAKYIAVTNYLVAEQGSHQFNLLQGIIKLFPYWLGYCIHDDEFTFFFNSVGYSEFSTNIYENVSWRSTVSFFQMQIAYWLGYRKVLLIGFDHSYSQDSAAREGDVLICKDDDINHFDPRYFKGKRWQAADVDNMEAMYLLAKQAFEQDGRQVINCTVGGHLEVFSRGDLKSHLLHPVTSIKKSKNIPKKILSSELYIKQANSLLQEQKWYEAIQAYKKGIEFNPKQPSYIYENLGEALMNYKYNFHLLADFLDEQESLNAASYYLEQANIYFNKKEWYEAIDFYRKANIVAPQKMTSVYEKLGEALIQERQSYPRLLIIDWTKIGSISATGQIKKNLFAEWPSDKLLQVFSKSSDEYGLWSGNNISLQNQVFTDQQQLLQECQKFNPDLIYYRPVADNLQFYDLANQFINHLDVPIVTHIMDDWINRLLQEEPTVYYQLEESIKSLFDCSSVCLSICDEMSQAFQERYNREFIPIMNCIEPQDWLLPKVSGASNDIFTIRYIGGLADDMNFYSISDLINSIQELNKELPIKIEIYTMCHWKDKAVQAFSHLPFVMISDSNLSQEDYHKLLMTADALVVAYNFDVKTINYVRYSLANKLPECMASGVPVLAYGPSEVATIAYAIASNTVEVVSERSVEKLYLAIKKLIQNPNYSQNLAQRSRQFVFKNHNAQNIRNKFYSVLKTTAYSNSI